MEKILAVDYKEIGRQIEEEQIEQYSKDQVMLDIIRQQVAKEVFEDIKFEMEESENPSNLRIVSTPIGERVKTESNNINVFVDQHSVGESGDSWAGVVSVELSNGRYLVWDYFMY